MPRRQWPAVPNRDLHGIIEGWQEDAQSTECGHDQWNPAPDESDCGVEARMEAGDFVGGVDDGLWGGLFYFQGVDRVGSGGSCAGVLGHVGGAG